MSELIKHECAIVLIRLLKPLHHYQEKYGSWEYGMQKLYLLLEKQHNRGQDGAGVACIKLDHIPGLQYYDIHRTVKSQPIRVLFDEIKKENNRIFPRKKISKKRYDPIWVKRNIPFAGELYLGHLRYGTFGRNTIGYVHPTLRANNWRSRNLMIAGNFNLTNVDEIFNMLLELGQHPRDYTDTVTILENVGHFLDRENQRLLDKYQAMYNDNKKISSFIEQHLDIVKVLHNSSKRWDGGYSIIGAIGHGDAFALRDPNGIRPCFYYYNDEVVVVASERPVIQTVFNVPFKEIKEVNPGHALIVRKRGTITHEQINKPQQRLSCSFERIYFSRGSDADIYNERKKLGKLLSPKILQTIDYDVENTVFSYIPNTSETAFLGMIDGIRDILLDSKKKQISNLNGKFSENIFEKIMVKELRVEKIAWKDVKLRTFITADNGRENLVEHIYDVTYGVIKPTDTLVVVDDSIVRGTTLKNSILRILNRLSPKKIIVVSSAPQIRYPDCYGIDMTRMNEFIAFNAAIALHKERGNHGIIKKVYKECIAQERLPHNKKINCVRAIYRDFTADEISNKISEILKNDNHIKADVQIIYQSIENLHQACPNHKGDWYFTGIYPTPGGNKVVNKAFINYIESRKGRSYQLTFFTD